jgi:D-aminopeptidase
VRRAIETATDGAVEEGSVGAGTGTRAFAWKGGIGTSSRRLTAAYGGYTVGVLVQTNYGGVLSIDGVPVGKLLGQYAYQPRRPAAERGDGSCMIVVATDAPLDARDLERLAARAVFGLARTGSSYSNGSGDYAVAFSTHPSLRVTFGADDPSPRTLLPTDGVSPLFQAVLEATEEAVYNSLFRATTESSELGTAEALPLDRVRDLLARYRPR